MMAYRGLLIIIVGAVVHHFSDCHALFDRRRRASGPEFIIFETVTVKSELEFTQEKIHNVELNIPHLVFRCQFNDWNLLFYTVNWYVDEKPFLGTMGPSRNIDDLVLREEHLLSNNISLGIYVRCGVRASMTANGIRTPLKMSEQLYAGIRIAESNVFLDKGSSAVVQFQSTVPIGCRYLSGLKVPCWAGLQMVVNDNPTFQCESETILIKSYDDLGCAKFIQTLKKGETWDPMTEYKVTIVTSDINYDDKDKFILKLQFGNELGHAIWKNYLFPDIMVFVHNMERYRLKICRSSGYSHHMTTADGYRYLNQVEGIYMLYVNTEYNIEVQQITKQCGFGWPNAICTCAVAISAGRDVFMINRCGLLFYFGFTQCGDGGILDVQQVSQLNYKVFTPIGTRISITLRTGSIWMNVEIAMAPKDMGNVYGLCGRVDGDKTNDLSHRNSFVITPLGTKQYNYHPEFSKSWRIDENANESLFRPTLRKLTPWIQQNDLYCACNVRANETLCSPTQYLNCTMPGSITKRKCHINGRNKRHIRISSSKEIQRIMSKITVHFEKRKKRKDIQDLVITEESRAICRGKISGIKAFTDFKDVGTNQNEQDVLRQCEFDLSAVTNTSWADVHVEVVNDGVKNMLNLQPMIVENSSEKVQSFFRNTCPMNCSNKGQCVDPGVCSCYKFYKGPDCSIDERDGLTIQDIEGGGESDLGNGEEFECFYVRSENIQENFTCSVNTSKIMINGNVHFISSDSFPGVYEDIFTGICCPPRRITGESDVFVAQYTIAISNNGLNFGNVENMYVFNSNCQKVSSNEKGNKSFELKDEYCFIDGICYSDDEMAPVGCRSCQSSTSPYSWTDKNPCLNGGYCSDETTGYICNCKAGFLGINCEFEINECKSNPCKNGGTCNNLENGFECSCVPGYEGVVCETVSNAIIGDDENTCAIYIQLHGHCDDGRRCMVKEGRPTCVSDPELDSNVLSHVTLVAICSLFVSVVVAASIIICLRGKYKRIINKTSDGKQRLESKTERIDSPKAYLL